MRADPWCKCGYRKSLHDAGTVPTPLCKELLGGFTFSQTFNGGPVDEPQPDTDMEVA